MQKQFSAIIAVCLALTGCVKDTAEGIFDLAVGDAISIAKSAKYKMAGECAKFCDANWWGTANTSDLQAELNAGTAVRGRDKNGNTPLHTAAWFGKPAHIKMLVGAGADVNALNTSGGAPLHQSADMGTPANIKALIAAGADANLIRSGYDGKTPLILASERTPAHLRPMLATANVFAANSSGVTVLNHSHIPAENMKLLVQAGGDVNKLAKCGETALYYAAKSGQPADVMFLLKAGANPKPTLKKKPFLCNRAASPLELASKNEKLKGTKAFYALRDATYK